MMMKYLNRGCRIGGFIIEQSIWGREEVADVIFEQIMRGRDTLIT